MGGILPGQLQVRTIAAERIVSGGLAVMRKSYAEHRGSPVHGEFANLRPNVPGQEKIDPKSVAVWRSIVQHHG